MKKNKQSNTKTRRHQTHIRSTHTSSEERTLTDDKEIVGPYTRDEGESASVHRRTADQQRTLHLYISLYIDI